MVMNAVDSKNMQRLKKERKVMEGECNMRKCVAEATGSNGNKWHGLLERRERRQRS